MRRPRLAIALGDPAGIGPEVALKAALHPRVRQACEPLLVGDRHALETHARACGLPVNIHGIPSAAAPMPEDEHGVALLDLRQFAPGTLALGRIAAPHGRSAVESARAAIDAALAGEVNAVIACPQTESAIHAAGIPFDGYPSFVARCTGMPAEDAFLMLCFDDVRIVHATLHVSLKRALQLLTPERVFRAIAATHAVLSRQGGTPRIAVAGINPHAGEGGLFGDEEALAIEPAMVRARRRGIHVEGPFGADTMFKRPGYDAFIAMYHDQGHLAAKLLATHRTVGMTIGAPILFCSVAHGSALDIAGQDKASPDAVIEAVLRLAHA